MSVKHALLALLSWRPSTTYQLRKDFDASTGQTWPLNIGQVSTTLQRMERDGLVTREAGSDDDPSVAGLWRLTDRGREEVAAWWRSPVSRASRGRDELVIKLALAAVVPGVDVADLVQRQRSAIQRTLHDLTRLRRSTDPADLPARLVLGNHIFTAEAELRWLDEVEETVARASLQAGAAPSHDRTVESTQDIPARSAR
ncbi:MAG: PadR family transcriptional regulator, partial [Dactylosporangium sp.]|nr:PadR family transcriptional regulator [Dactylosporangium sp.]